MMKKYAEEIEIRYHYADWRGRLLLKALCDLFNDVANAQTLELGFDVPTLNAQGLTWMLHKLHVQVERMPRQGETIRLETWPSGTDRLFALRDFRMTDREGSELVLASSEWMVIDLGRRRPVRLPACVLNVAKECEDVIPQLPFALDVKQLKVEEGYSREFVATYDNIDFNKHVTQATYVRWLTNALPYDFLKTHEIREIEVVYEHEIMPDSDIYSECSLQMDGDLRVVVNHCLLDKSRERTHCQARSVWEKVAD